MLCLYVQQPLGVAPDGRHVPCLLRMPGVNTLFRAPLFLRVVFSVPKSSGAILLAAILFREIGGLATQSNP